MAGHNELSLSFNGDDRTLSTLTNTEKFIHNHFGLDFDIFTSSVFFGQFSKSFLEMSDQKRRAALERLLNLDKLNIWATVAKDKLDRAETELARLATKIESRQEELDRLKDQRHSLNELKDGFDNDREQRISVLSEKLAEETNKLESISVPDIPKLQTRWDAISKIMDRLNQYENKRNTLKEGIERSENTITANNSSIAKIDNNLSTAKSYDLTSLEVEHQQNSSNKEKTYRLGLSIKEVETTLVEKSTTLKNLLKTAAEWKEKENTTCPYCKQQISQEYVGHICEPFTKQAEILRSEIAELRDNLAKLQDEFSNIPDITNPISLEEASRVNASFDLMQEERTRLASSNATMTAQITESKSEIGSITKLVDRVRKQAKEHAPSMTLDEARKIQSAKEQVENTIVSLRDKIESIKDQANPHIQSVKLTDDKIGVVEEVIKASRAARTKLHVFFTHLSYIRSAYKDRTKIKSYILSSLIPILNRRIQYYLESFDCEFAMEFTPSLSILPSKWDYHLCSGGERKRIDMAMMFALYDLYIHMHGQQCNIMILDEVDGRLDADGIQAFIDIIHNDFSSGGGSRPKPDSILIISHRPEMLDAFPSKILVKKSQGFSFIESVI